MAPFGFAQALTIFRLRQILFMGAPVDGNQFRLLGFPLRGSQSLLNESPEQKWKLLTRLKHLHKTSKFVTLLNVGDFGTRGSEVQILSPRPFIFNQIRAFQSPENSRRR